MKLDPRVNAADLPKLNGDRPEQHRRRTGRLPQESLVSNLGMVLDISVGGMRVLCRKVPTGKIDVQLVGYDLPGTLSATPAWSKKVGFFKSEVGLRFEEVTPEMALYLTRIAATHRFRRVI